MYATLSLTMYMYIYLHTCRGDGFRMLTSDVYVYTYTYTYTHTYIHICRGDGFRMLTSDVYVYTYTYTYTHIHTYMQGRWIPYADIRRLDIVKEKDLLKRLRGTFFFDKEMLPNRIKLDFHESPESLVTMYMCMMYIYAYICTHTHIHSVKMHMQKLVFREGNAAKRDQAGFQGVFPQEKLCAQPFSTGAGHSRPQIHTHTHICMYAHTHTRTYQDHG
jgi:hypothetical protein